MGRAQSEINLLNRLLLARSLGKIRGNTQANTSPFFLPGVVLIILKKTDGVATKDENLSVPKVLNKAFVRKKVML